MSYDEDSEKVKLGKRLFTDVRLSTDNSISCASCHILEDGGADKTRYSLGVNQQVGEVNTPTVYNSMFNLSQFWDGRAATLEDQASGPVHNPIEMASNWNEVIGKLMSDKEYVDAFSRIYENGSITPDNIVDAIVSFEKTLITPNSPFDRWLNGDENAITEDEKKGYLLFKSYGCVACHQGVNVGGNMYQQMGAIKDYFSTLKRDLTKADLGRFNVTGKNEDKHFFKVPSLRLASKTSPYFHDGSAETLSDAVEVMAEYQLGRKIPEDHIYKIVQFIETLAGKHKLLRATP